MRITAGGQSVEVRSGPRVLKHCLPVSCFSAPRRTVCVRVSVSVPLSVSVSILCVCVSVWRYCEHSAVVSHNPRHGSLPCVSINDVGSACCLTTARQKEEEGER